MREMRDREMRDIHCFALLFPDWKDDFDFLRSPAYRQVAARGPPAWTPSPTMLCEVRCEVLPSHLDPEQRRELPSR
jgi:hypothetical protein